MNHLLTFLNQVPLYIVVAFLVSQVVPYVAAALNKHKTSWWYGATSYGLNLLTSFLAELGHVAATNAGFSWGQAFAMSWTLWVASGIHHNLALSGTTQEDNLLKRVLSKRAATTRRP